MSKTQLAITTATLLIISVMFGPGAQAQSYEFNHIGKVWVHP